MDYVIVGCGAAGLKTAVTIREHDADGKISVISSDLWPLYIKPVLPDFITGKLDLSRMAYMSAKKIEDLKISVVGGKRVTSIVPEENKLIFSDHSTMPYQFLTIATGARPDIPEEYRRFYGKFRLLNSLSDAVRIKNEALRGNKAVVVGGGHYALEMLRALHALKYDLTLLTSENDFWPKNDPLPGDDIRQRLEKEKIRIHWNQELLDIIDLDGESYRVFTADGSSFDTQMVLYAPRFVPNMDFVLNTKIKTDKGIIVSEDLRTSVPNIFACGDVAQIYDLNRNLNRINFGWASAGKQGEIAGLNMVGRDTCFIPANEEYYRQMYGNKLLNRW